VADELYRYLATVCTTSGCPPHKIGGTRDHVHILFSLSRTITVAKFVETVKTASSKWIKVKGVEFTQFAWQNGYGAFSIGQSQFDTVRRYIETQEEHHQKRTFQDEFRALLRRYGVEFDERFVWD